MFLDIVWGAICYLFWVAIHPIKTIRRLLGK